MVQRDAGVLHPERIKPLRLALDRPLRDAVFDLIPAKMSLPRLLRMQS